MEKPDKPEKVPSVLGPSGEKPTEEQVEKLEEKLEAAQGDQKNLFLIIFQVIMNPPTPLSGHASHNSPVTGFIFLASSASS